MIGVRIMKNGADVLRAVSDGEGNYRVHGSALRHSSSQVVDDGGERGYSTTDDLHVIGEIIRCLTALYGQEAIRAALSTRKEES